MFKKTLAITGMATVAALVFSNEAQARDQIRAVGSSTVYPFTTAVAEQFGKQGAFKTPVVESTGTGGGIKLFCAGLGPDTADVVNASRKIKDSELETCVGNGVTDVVEVKIGYDGIVLATAKGAAPMPLTRDQFWRAVAKDVVVDGKLVPNPYKLWSDIDPSLPKQAIAVFGPAPNHGTRDAVVELIFEPACNKVAEIKALDKDAKKAACQTVRTDGAWTEVSDSYNVVLQKLQSSPQAVGVFGYSYLEQNQDKVQASPIDGVVPTYDGIADGSYPISRPLWLYIKGQHVGQIPGLKEFLTEYTSEKAWGDEGYLADKGLIAMPKGERTEWAQKASAMTPMSKK